MSAAPAYRIEVVADYVLPDGVKSAGVFIRCSCQVEPQAIPLHILADTVALLRQLQLPGDRPILSYRCRSCRKAVAITARMLYLAA